jgi:hypothetical protein
MADDAYSGFKEEQKVVSVLPETGGPVFRFRLARRTRETPDYSSFKAAVESAMESAVEKLKLEMVVQHEQTRAEVQTVRRDVLAAIKTSPAEYLKLLCEFGSLFLLFSLAIRFILKIELVNTGFALFMLVAFAVYWAMARLKQESDKRRREDTQA